MVAPRSAWALYTAYGYDHVYDSMGTCVWTAHMYIITYSTYWLSSSAAEAIKWTSVKIHFSVLAIRGV